MKNFLCAFWIIFFIAVSVSANSNCPTIPKHYQELNCEPIIKDGDACPSSYKCPELEDISDPEKCLVNGKLYERGEIIPKSETSKCHASCVCDKLSKPAKLNCTHIYCPPLKSGCIHQINFNDCCPGKSICHEEEIANLTQCEFGGKLYYQGQLMYSREYPCHSCQCQPDFDSTNILNNPNCQMIDCGIKSKIKRLLDGCAPLYYGKSVCCPIDWICRRDTQARQINEINENSIENSEHGCKFGKSKLKIGESVSDLRYAVNCTCQMPPYVQCEQKFIEYSQSYAKSVLREG